MLSSQHFAIQRRLACFICSSHLFSVTLGPTFSGKSSSVNVCLGQVDRRCFSEIREVSVHKADFHVQKWFFKNRKYIFISKHKMIGLCFLNVTQLSYTDQEVRCLWLCVDFFQLSAFLPSSLKDTKSTTNIYQQ